MIRKNECYRVSKNYINQLQGLPLIPSAALVEPVETNEQEKDQSDPLQHLNFGSLDLQPSSEPTVQYAIYQKGFFKLGILRIQSFSSNNEFEITRQIRRLLTNELQDTHGLMMDVRSNEGSNVVIADMLPQFFVPEFQPTAVRLLSRKHQHFQE